MSAKERPLLFSGPMVRAILAGTKTVTRRVYRPREGSPYEIMGEDDSGKPWPMWLDPNHGPEYHPVRCPYGSPGERLWVKETYALHRIHDETSPSTVFPTLLSGCWYRADGEPDMRIGRWRPSIHMPRWASRLTLEVVSVRVERLHELTEEDAQAEGVERWVTGSGWQEYGLSEAQLLTQGPPLPTARLSFKSLWESINGPGSWEANPWVWVVSFRRLT